MMTMTKMLKKNGCRGTHSFQSHVSNMNGHVLSYVLAGGMQSIANRRSSGEDIQCPVKRKRICFEISWGFLTIQVLTGFAAVFFRCFRAAPASQMTLSSFTESESQSTDISTKEQPNYVHSTSDRLQVILNMPAVRMAVESMGTMSVAEVDDASEVYSKEMGRSAGESCILESNEHASFGISEQQDKRNGDSKKDGKSIRQAPSEATTIAHRIADDIFRRLHLPAMDDPSSVAAEARLAMLGGWVGSLSVWIEAASEGRLLRGAQASAVEGFQRILEDGHLVAGLAALVRHGQAGVQEYASEVLGRLYVAPLMEAQSEPATRAARLDELMFMLERDGALQACLDVLAAPSCGTGRSEVDADAGGALPCTVLSALNCVQSVVTFRPDALARTACTMDLVLALARTARRSVPAAFRLALSTSRASVAVPMLCGGRTAADMAAAEGEASVWAWEVQESTAMTLAQVRIQHKGNAAAAAAPTADDSNRDCVLICLRAMRLLPTAIKGCTSIRQAFPPVAN